MSAQKRQNKKEEKQDLNEKSKGNFFLLSALLLLIFSCGIYFKSLNNGFTNWDDEKYVLENPDIRTLHADSIGFTIKNAFTSFTMGNYHPITMLSYAIEYSAFKLNPKPYHVTNLIFHLLNVLLVFYFIWLLTKQKITALLTALLFAIHPLHVESVAWVSERKDVLYTFFSMATLCCYLKFSSSSKRKMLNYSALLFLFVLALFSKAMAVSIPLLFIAIDYYLGRKITIKSLSAKVPFFILSLIFGIVAIKAQKSFNALVDIADYDFVDRILFSCYGIITYLWKALLPINLSCFYSYPFKTDGFYPLVYYTMPLIILLLLFFLYRSKIDKKNVWFGLGFFLITIIMVLQILPVGGAIIAERYTYIPYIGLFFIVGHFYNGLYENKFQKLTAYKLPLSLLLGCFILFNTYQAHARTKVWENSVTLWTDAIEKYSMAPRTYSHRAKAHYRNGQYENAVVDYSKYILIKDDNYQIYYDRGLAYFNLKEYEYSIADFTKSLEMNPEFQDAYYNRGIVYNDLGQFEKAIGDYTNAIKYKEDFSLAYYNRAGAYYLTKQFQPALKDALKAQELGFRVDSRFIEAIKKGIK